MEVISATMDECIPVVEESPYMKQWWTKKLQKLWRKWNKLSNWSERRHSEPHHPVHDQYQEVHTPYQAEIWKAKTACWDDYFNNATPEDLWSAHRYLMSWPTDGGASRILTLTTTLPDGERINHTLNKEKSQAFKTFFPTPE